MNKVVCGIAMVVTIVSGISVSYANELTDYCEQSGGQVERMPAQFMTGSGLREGLKKPFCTFRGADYFAAVGLSAFASSRPNLAATYIKRLQPIEPNSPLLQGNFSNPSSNVCKNLGGANISFISGGGFTNQLGQNDICVFGDGSMVSGWTLIYIANHRDGYLEIKDRVRSQSLNISIP